MPITSMSVASEGYTFGIFNNGRIITESKDGREEELAVIARAYTLYKKREKHRGPQRKGIWKRCSNPGCKMVLYVNQSQISQKRGSFCSHNCQGKVFWIPKRNQSSCKHHWIIETPDGETSRGVCKLCGAVKDFENFFKFDYCRGRITFGGGKKQ